MAWQLAHAPRPVNLRQLVAANLRLPKFKVCLQRMASGFAEFARLAVQTTPACAAPATPSVFTILIGAFYYRHIPREWREQRVNVEGLIPG